MFFKVALGKEVHIFNPKTEPTYQSLNAYIREVFRILPAKFQLSYMDEDNDQITLANQNDFKIMRETANKTVRIIITEVNEDFYDQTQKVVLDDDFEEVKEKISQIELEEKESVEPEQISLKQQEVIEANTQMKSLDQSYISNSNSDISQLMIEEKFRKMMPELIEHVKKTLVTEKKEEPAKIEEPVRAEEPQVEKSSTIVHSHIICDDCGKKDIEGVRYKCAVCADFDLCQDCEAVSQHDHPFLKIKHPKQAPYKIIAIVNDEENSFEVNGNRVQLPNFPFVNQMVDAFCGPRQPRPEGFHPRGHPFFGGEGRRGCPFGKKSRKCEKQMNKQEQEKPESPIVETKIEQEPVINKKVKTDSPLIETKPENQPEIVEQVKEVKVAEEVPNIVEQKKAELSEDEKLMNNATYLSDILDIDYNRCYKFAVRHSGLNKEELLEMYFVNTASI